MEISGKALADVYDPKDATKVLAKAGEQLAGFAQLRDDGSTSCGNWIYCGSWSQAGNLTARRDNSDPSGLGQTLNWGFAWPANRRILYNRASCDLAGKPWDPKRTVIKWNGDEVGRQRRARHASGRRARRRRDALHHEPGRRGPAVRAGAWPTARSPSTTSRSRRRWTPTRCTRTTRRRSAIRPPACSRATWRCSARPRTSRTWPPPTA